ncbi:MAG: nucleotide exchange factor GrpE [Acidobacteria bacterium]|nr:nucleotide exchange factor GrpE [Acidobacteriota bacterium]
MSDGAKKSAKAADDSVAPESEAPEAGALESEAPGEESEGWEALAEEAPEGVMAPGEELEAALREAIDATEAKQEPAKAATTLSADEMMLEALSSELQTIKSEYEEKLAELDAVNDRHVRLQAEFENFRRRSLKERQEAFSYGHQNIVKDLLTTVDNLERASQHAEGSGGGDLQALLQGVDLVCRELLGVFGKYGVTRIEALNQPFDPALHEAMGQIEDGSVAPNTVVQVLQVGYQLRDRMLRPARVMVARLPDAEKQEGAQEEGDKE